MTICALTPFHRRCVHQCEDAFFLCAVIERAKGADFVETSHAIERIKKLRVARSQLCRLEITAAQIFRLKRARILRREKMKTKPASICPRDLLRLSKKGDEKQQDKIGIDACL